jgi:hypothetical protein
VNILKALGPVAGIHTKIAVVLYRQPDQTEDRLVCFFSGELLCGLLLRACPGSEYQHDDAQGENRDR